MATVKTFIGNIKGTKGDKGDSAGFGTPTAQIDANTGTPSVTITASGADTAKVFNFDFKNLKGEKGEKGEFADVDYELSETSENPVQNKVITNEIKTIENALSVNGIKNAVDTSFELNTANGGIRVNKIVGKTHKSKNLLKSKIESQTKNGITLTANSNGTYTLNGTATNTTTFILGNSEDVANWENGKTYKLTGCPVGGIHDQTYQLSIESFSTDYGNGYVNVCDTSKFDGDKTKCYIAVFKDYVCDNLVFKPMLTTDTTVTYDDYEPYGIYNTGETLIDGKYGIKIIENNENNTESKTIIITLDRQLYKDGIITVDSITENWGVKDLGELTWYIKDSTAVPGTKYFTTTLTGVKFRNVSEGETLICALYNNVQNNYTDKNMYIANASGTLVIRNDDYTDASSFKTAMNGVMLYYELANPVITTTTLEQKKAISSLLSFDGKTYIDTTDTYAKATLDLDYSPSETTALGLLAYNNAVVESCNVSINQNSMTSDVWKSGKTYSVGDYVIYNNSIWKCKVQHVGQTPSEGTYWTKTSITNELKALWSAINA